MHLAMFWKINDELGELHMVSFGGVSTKDEILWFRTILALSRLIPSASERNELITSSGSLETSLWFREINILKLNL